MNKKEYRYRKHIRWGQYAIPAFFGGLVGIGWLFVLFSFLIQGSVHQPAVLGISMLTLLLVVEGVFLWLFYYRLAGMRVSIGENEVVYKTRRNEVTIPFVDIQKLQFPSIRYLGGWIKIVSQKKAIRLTVVIEDIGSLLQDLKTALDQKGLSDCYDQKKFFHFLKTAVYTDQSWARLYRIFWKFNLLTIASAIIGALCATLASLGVKDIVLWMMIAALWPTAVYLFTEYLFGRYVAKGSDKGTFVCPSANHSYEKKVYQNSILVGISVYVALSIITFFVVTGNVN